MKDQTTSEILPQPDSFLEKLEQATPAQVSQALIAKIMQKLSKSQNS